MGLLRQLEEPLSALVRHGELRKRGEGPPPPQADDRWVRGGWARNVGYSDALYPTPPTQPSFGGYYSTSCTLKRFVPPALPAGNPAVIPILSPFSAKPAPIAARAQVSIRSSVSWVSSRRAAVTPQRSWQRRTMSRPGARGSTGARGR